MKKICFFLMAFLFLSCTKWVEPQAHYGQDQLIQTQSGQYYGQTDEIGGYASRDYEGDYAFEASAVPPSVKTKKSSSKQNYNSFSKKSLGTQENIARMIHYNGYANLRVARPEETIEDIIALSRKVNGSIERRSTISITIRVPKESFEEVFATILAMGDVLTKSVTSEDVTEAFTSVELRLQTAKTTRDRLITLLERTDDEKEKINILRQIQRLNEQIDLIEAQMRTLQNLAELSSISIDVDSRKARTNLGHESAKREPAGFAWIHTLSPFQNKVCSAGKRLELPTPLGLVSLHPKGPYTSESADGVVLRTAKLNNNPQGDGHFWQNAIYERLKDGFGKVEKGTLGPFSTITFYEDSDNPYIWMIAVRKTDKSLEFMEVYYPSDIQRERYQSAIEASIIGGEQ